MPKTTSSAGKKKHDLRPPNPPWVPLPAADPPCGVLAFFLSDDLSRLPVREVTRPGDNKSDPNLETGTFGMFSTCEQQMRSSVVSNGIPYIFFVTRRGNERVLVGYYEVGWYSDSVLSGGGSDYGLAASGIHFVRQPVPLSKLPKGVSGHAMKPFRTFLHLDERQTRQILRVLDRQDNATTDYLAEIDRLERLNKFHTGFRCWNRTEPFSWDDAHDYLSEVVGGGSSERVPNSSPTGKWRCQSCGKLIENKALLKKCPACGTPGALRPEG
jgi:hypothetical protein